MNDPSIPNFFLKYVSFPNVKLRLQKNSETSELKSIDHLSLLFFDENIVYEMVLRASQATQAISPFIMMSSTTISSKKYGQEVY